jgi:hypothetical protein
VENAVGVVGVGRRDPHDETVGRARHVDDGGAHGQRIGPDWLDSSISSDRISCDVTFEQMAEPLAVEGGPTQHVDLRASSTRQMSLGRQGLSDFAHREDRAAFERFPARIFRDADTRVLRRVTGAAVGAYPAPR